MKKHIYSLETFGKVSFLVSFLYFRAIALKGGYLINICGILRRLKKRYFLEFSLER